MICVNRVLLRSPRRSRSERPGGTEAGFTLVELMVVVVIISILCVLAIPTLSHEGYERRAFTDAANVSELVREARTRAIARGLAELVVMSANSAGNTASFMLYEATSSTTSDAGVTSTTAYSSCGAPTVWPGATGTVTATLIDGFQIAPTSSGTNQTIEGLGNVNMRVNDPNLGTSIGSDNLYLCFTPAGRTWYGRGSAPPSSFASLASAGGIGAVTVDVTTGSFPTTGVGGTSATNLIRTVWIPPSGATRITSQ